MSIVPSSIHQGPGPGIQVELPHFFLKCHTAQQIVHSRLQGEGGPLVREGGIGGSLRGSRSSPGQKDGTGYKQDGQVNNGQGGSSFPPFRLKSFRAQLASFGS